MDALKLVIVGHVDHGKSTLIGRLLYDTGSLAADKMAEVREASRSLGRKTEFAFVLDHLREEREQGITIDTAQTFFRTKKREYVIIDAPGHRAFARNMITGASQAQAAVLIVDVQQGVQEQTKRHAYILALLGIEQLIVVLNKMDAIAFKEERFNEVKAEVGRFLDSIKIKTALYIPISAIEGDNVARKSQHMPWYNGLNILESLDSLKNPISTEDRALVFPVQDVYKMDGKRIAVGRIEAGRLKKGAGIKILPQGEIAKIESIEKFLEKIDEAGPEECIGITTAEPVFWERGNIICEPLKEPSLVDAVGANVFWMSKEDLKRGQGLSLKCATQKISCKIEKIVQRIDSSTLDVIEEDAERLKCLEVGEVIIRTKKPIVLEGFSQLKELGRFVLVKDENTCAGGIITRII